MAGTATPDTHSARLADGVELIGRFEDSGFKEAPYIARRADGQVVQMPGLLYALAEEVDGGRPPAEIAERLSHRIQRGVSGDAVEMLIDEKLRPLGIVAPETGELGPELRKVDPLLALRLRTKVVPEHVVRALTSIFRPLFAPPVVVLALAAFVGLDAWLFGVHGISQSLRHVLYDPALLLMLLAGVVVATAFHEIGHATACRYGGARPGVMGVGIYIVWPAFYTDITDAYRLGKGGRLRADTGGMYFNALFALAMIGVYLATDFEPILLLVVLQNFAIVQQSLPFLRLDGYYIISDLTGVPDMLSRVKPVLRSLLPGRPADRRVTELKPWVRRAVTGYVVTVIPVLLLAFLLMLVHAPRAFATGYDSVVLHSRAAGSAFGHHRALAGAMDVIETLVLVMPAVGLVYSAGRVGRRAGPAAWRWSDGSVSRRSAVLAGATAAAAGLAFLWWPHGDYRPIQPGERGTIVSAIRNLSHLPGGRAALTVQRRSELGGAPFVSSRHHDAAKDRSARDHGGAKDDHGGGPFPADGSTTTAPDSGQAPLWYLPSTQSQTTTATTTQTAPQQSPAPTDGSTSTTAQPAPAPPPTNTTSTDTTTTTTTTSTTQTTPTTTSTTETTPTTTTP